MGCDVLCLCVAKCLLVFQSTHPRGVRHALPYVLFQFYPFQSTHPRGVRQRIKFMQQLCNSISIHAPTWGATLYFWYFSVDNKISIHAPTWGATSEPSGIIGRSLFQSTHPRGVRRVWVNSRLLGHPFQSTHPRGVRQTR